jgi:hypothetical protein
MIKVRTFFVPFIKSKITFRSFDLFVPYTAFYSVDRPFIFQAGVIVALGTDFNPNAHCLSMPLVMHLACVNLRSEILFKKPVFEWFLLASSRELEGLLLR